MVVKWDKLDKERIREEIKKDLLKKKQEKDKWWRPSKLTEDFLSVTEEVVNDDMNSIVFSDEELLFQINDRLPKRKQVWLSTFKLYKHYIKTWKVEGLKKVDINKLKKFLDIYKKALQKQKNVLFQSLKKDSKAWQRRAWIIERKFDEWNIKRKEEIKQETTVSWEIKIKLPEENKPEENNYLDNK